MTEPTHRLKVVNLVTSADGQQKATASCTQCGYTTSVQGWKEAGLQRARRDAQARHAADLATRGPASEEPGGPVTTASPETTRKPGRKTGEWDWSDPYSYVAAAGVAFVALALVLVTIRVVGWLGSPADPESSVRYSPQRCQALKVVVMANGNSDETRTDAAVEYGAHCQ